MAGIVTYSNSYQQAHLSVAIDYPTALALGQMALAQDELPKYLLPISALLHCIPDLYLRTLLAARRNTSARINEALALTQGYFRRRLLTHS